MEFLSLVVEYLIGALENRAIFLLRQRESIFGDDVPKEVYAQTRYVKECHNGYLKC